MKKAVVLLPQRNTAATVPRAATKQSQAAVTHNFQLLHVLLSAAATPSFCCKLLPKEKLELQPDRIETDTWCRH